jgi:hypothetical protein
MALTADIMTTSYGPAFSRIEYPIGKGASGQTLYRGSVTAVSGGTTVTQGFLKNMATPASTDLVVGIVDDYGPSCGLANTGPGLGGATLNTANGVCTALVRQGEFILASGTGADALTITNLQTNVYLINETTVGATSGGSTRPVAGLLVALPSTDASISTGYCVVAVGTQAGPWGGFGGT